MHMLHLPVFGYIEINHFSSVSGSTVCIGLFMYEYVARAFKFHKLHNDAAHRCSIVTSDIKLPPPK